MAATVETIVNTYNLFVDTSRGNSTDSTGDNYNLNLGNAKIVCDEGQYIRLTLTQFGMHKTWTDINATNSPFTLRLNSNAYSSSGSLTYRNNLTLNALATDFATQCAATLKTALSTSNFFVLGGTNATLPANDLTPSDTANLGGNSDYIISFTLYCVNNLTAYALTNHGITNAVIQFYLQSGDTHEILGGNRIENINDTTTSSVTITFPAANSIKVQCLCPAQRHTNDYVYLRNQGTVNTALETLGLTNPYETHNTDTTDSYILAKIPSDVEYLSYESQTNREYFINVRQKVLTSLRLKLTDKHARPLARSYGSSLKTASGTGLSQSTLGNLHFSAVFRIGIVQQLFPNYLQTPPVPRTTATRFETLLSYPKFGRDAYGTGVGK